MIDTYELRRRFDDLKYRAGLLPKRTLVLGGVACVLAPITLIVLYLAMSGGGTGNAEADAKFRARSREAIESESGKSDLAKLSGMQDKDLQDEVSKRHQALNDIDRAGKLGSPEGEAAWGAVLRATQVQSERARRAPKKEDR